jgi:hypothetical protein
MLILGVEAGGAQYKAFSVPLLWELHMVSLEIHATDASGLHAQLAGIGGKAILCNIGTSDLIEELRERMAKKGHSVEIEPFPPFEGEPDGEANA